MSAAPVAPAPGPIVCGHCVSPERACALLAEGRQRGLGRDAVHTETQAERAFVRSCWTTMAGHTCEQDALYHIARGYVPIRCSACGQWGGQLCYRVHRVDERRRDHAERPMGECGWTGSGWAVHGPERGGYRGAPPATLTPRWDEVTCRLCHEGRPHREAYYRGRAECAVGVHDFKAGGGHMCGRCAAGNPDWRPRR